MCFKLSSFFSLVLYFFLLSSSRNRSLASDTISQGQYISGNETIISNAGLFELGFFTPGNSRNYYIGIWFKTISNHTVIWVANRETPVSDPATSKLELNKYGNLILYSKSRQVWSSNSTSASVAAVLLDTGNLVLRQKLNTSSIVWQSFDHPTDTMMPGSCLGMNKLTGEHYSLRPWRNSEDPAPGPFTDTADSARQLSLTWNNSNVYWKSGVWDGKSFITLPWMNQNTLIVNKFVDDEKIRCFSYTLTSDKFLARNFIDSSGQAQQWLWFSESQGWLLVFARPMSPCDVYSVCGVFGVCNQKNAPTTCSCPIGFSPTAKREWELGGWSSGCSRNTHLNCDTKNSSSGEKDGFVAMSNMRLPEDFHPSAAASIEECEADCLKDCSCTAYAYDTKCSIWIGDVRNLQIQEDDADTEPATLHLRLAASDIPPSKGNKQIIPIAVSIAAGIILAIVIAAIWMVYKRKHRGSRSTEGPLVSFTYSDLQRITKNFSQKLGTGGFGSVFKGVLPNSTVVAVKRLEGVRQGEKQFRSELGTLGAIQHVNLVRLCGFCCEGTERMLVYEYMPNGSLDHHLFKQEPESSLDWKTRYQIILGVAKGLVYLHEQCRECIIHCDIKPENVLLDSENHPKLSDFGMAKLLGHDFSRVLTTIRGTIGYLAPEWIEGLPVTPKVDVYSFGMMLFEVVSGKRNNSDIRFFPVEAASKVIDGEVASLLDERLNGCSDVVELTRVCRVACWCIQDDEMERPTMQEVVKMLEGASDLKVPPFPRTLQYLVYEDPVTCYHQELSGR